MEFIQKIKESFSSLIGGDRKKNSLIKSEIDSIIRDIDENEESFKEMIGCTADEMEKGFTEGDSLKGRIVERYKSRERQLLTSLAEKKQELIKGKKPQCYADSIIKDGKGNILMLLRNPGDEFEPNKWGLPGGKIEEGEEPIQAAYREVYEETYLKGPDAYITKVKKLDDGGKIHYFTMYIQESSGVNTNWIALDEEEHSNYVFMSVDEIRRRPASDFILELQKTLLDMVDPMAVHFNVIEKGLEIGLIEEEKYLEVTKFNFEKRK